MILNISEKPMQIVSSVFPENYSKLLVIKFCARVVYFTYANTTCLVRSFNVRVTRRN